MADNNIFISLSPVAAKKHYPQSWRESGTIRFPALSLAASPGPGPGSSASLTISDRMSREPEVTSRVWPSPCRTSAPGRVPLLIVYSPQQRLRRPDLSANPRRAKCIMRRPPYRPIPSTTTSPNMVHGSHLCAASSQLKRRRLKRLTLENDVAASLTDRSMSIKAGCNNVRHLSLTPGVIVSFFFALSTSLE